MEENELTESTPLKRESKKKHLLQCEGCDCYFSLSVSGF
jgi:hypothetical protein